MKKREFIGSAALLATVPSGQLLARQTPKHSKSPTLLTVTGLIGKGNRGALDPALDQLMAKQKIKFDTAMVFNFATLAALPSISIRPTLEYDNKAHTLRGPLLTNVVAATGAPKVGTRFLMRAIDGYTIMLSLADAVKYRFIVATHLDGEPLPLGGLGPTWAVYDADHFPEQAAKPVTDRFSLCPWGLYHIEVQAAT
jgi:hypothetical protein